MEPSLGATEDVRHHLAWREPVGGYGHPSGEGELSMGGWHPGPTLPRCDECEPEEDMSVDDHPCDDGEMDLEPDYRHPPRVCDGVSIPYLTGETIVIVHEDARYRLELIRGPAPPRPGRLRRGRALLPSFQAPAMHIAAAVAALARVPTLRSRARRALKALRRAEKAGRAGPWEESRKALVAALRSLPRRRRVS